MEALVRPVLSILFTVKLGMLLLVRQALMVVFLQQALKLVALLSGLEAPLVLPGRVLHGQGSTITLILPMLILTNYY